jgi:hypothetical protein
MNFINQIKQTTEEAIEKKNKTVANVNFKDFNNFNRLSLFFMLKTLSLIFLRKLLSTSIKVSLKCHARTIG